MKPNVHLCFSQFSLFPLPKFHANSVSNQSFPSLPVRHQFPLLKNLWSAGCPSQSSGFKKQQVLQKVCCCPEIWNTSNTTQVSHRLIWNEMPPFYLTSARLGLHWLHATSNGQFRSWSGTRTKACVSQSKSCKFKWFVARNKARQVWQTIA